MKFLTDLQEKVLGLLFKEEIVRRHFYLTGGTALAAYYLHHRVSDDLDLFTHSVEIASVDRAVEDCLRDAGIAIARERSSSTFRRFRLDGKLQLDLVRDVDARVGAPEIIDGIMVDTPKNIAVNKVLAIYGRLDPKDYVDLFFLLRAEKFDILDLLALAKRKDAGIEPFEWARVIADAESISVLPRMAKPLPPDELKAFYRKLRDRVLDAIKPPPA